MKPQLLTNDYKPIGVALTALDIIVALSAPFLAAALREWFEYRTPMIPLDFLPYALSSAAASLFMLRFLRISNATWPYFSACDAINTLRAGFIGIAGGLLVGFSYDRLESVARSVPFLHFFVQTAWLVGPRLLLVQRILRDKANLHPCPASVLILGCNATAVIYMRAVESLSHGTLEVVGLLAEEPSLVGATLRGKRIIGTIAHIEKTIVTLKVHGINVSRLVLATVPEALPKIELANLMDIAERFTLPLIQIHSLLSEATCPRRTRV